METIVLGGGCFWCTEAILKDLRGVEAVESGYAGGHTINPTYEQVCSGDTGHAEVVQISFNPQYISLHDLLTIFFTLHDPTTPDQQGADRGPAYRSIVLYSTPEQREVTFQVMQEIEESGIWPDPLVTEVVPLERFYPAEEYHQDYYEQNISNPYCQVVIAPKVVKLRKLYTDRLKAE